MLLVGAFALAIGIAAWFGLQLAPDPMVTDPRRSSYLTGPNGASALAEVLERFGATVERHERPFFVLDTTGLAGSRAWLAVLEPDFSLAESELRSVGHWLAAGGSIFAAGETGIEECFGVRVLPFLPTTARRPTRAIRERGSLDVRETRAEFRPLRESQQDEVSTECSAFPAVVDREVVLTTAGNDSVAIMYTMATGARALLLADSRYVANEDLRETDAGSLVLPLLLEHEPSVVTIDEFHHDFGPGGSLYGAAMSWMRRTPAGWAMIQIVFVAILAIFARAIRFGPALEVVHRERRSPLDHVDALATGLARARSADAAVTLLVDGLRRRLGRPATGEQATPERLSAWLDTLKLATRTDTARAAVDRLKAALNKPADRRSVLDAALTVEELWKALQPESALAKSRTR